MATMCSLLFSAAYLLLFVTLTRAIYYIDDTNSTIQYTPSGAWTAMAENGCFNNTMTLIWPHAPADLHVIIPFTGSGIAVFVYQPNLTYMNVSIVLDGGPPKIQTVFQNETGYSLYNASLYNVQSLSFSGHVIDIALQYFHGTHLFFDYAAVNDTQPSPTSSAETLTSKSAPTSESTSTSTSTKSSNKHIGAIIGGVVGALATIAAIIIALLFCRRRKKARDQPLINPEPKTTLFDTRASISSRPPSLVGEDAADWRKVSNADVAFNAAGGASSIPPETNTQTFISPCVVALDLSNDISDARVADTQLANNPPLLEIENTAIPSSHNPEASIPPLDAFNYMESGQLTVEQLVTLQTLYALNTPPAEIVGVMERMRASELPSSNRGPTPGPPGYDSIPPGGLR